jgi:phosphohistidine swiveling domain-containing protein
MKTIDSPYILSLDSDNADLPSAGGKGLNLCLLTRAGFPVPPGYILSTAAYDDYMRSNQLDEVIASALQDLAVEDANALEEASQTIRAGFAAGQLSTELSQAIVEIDEALDRAPAAVRSSATAEDLPGHSFAGQQDTFLNVVGEDAIATAVIKCWSSLWTARAIGYRARSGLDRGQLSLAVIIQHMVPSDSSGVLFTANPLTGKRDELVIDAVFGLGEALVSGQVEPDHYLVDPEGTILHQTLGSKSVLIRSADGGGTQTLAQEAASRQVLSEKQLSELAGLGISAAELFGSPQDIEWAIRDERLWLLQSRPITTLYPLPEGLAPEPLRVLLSFGAVQGMLDPITPLGRDALRNVFVGGAELFGYHFTLETVPTLLEAGERLWVDASGILKTGLGRRIMKGALDYVEPGAGQGLAELLQDGSFPAPLRVRPAIFRYLVKTVLPLLPRVFRTLCHPDAQRNRLLEQMESWLGKLQAQIQAAETPAQLLALIRRTASDAFYFLLPQFVPRFAVGMATYNLLTKLAASLQDESIDTRMMMRGLPGNVTTEMDLDLWGVSQDIREDQVSCALFKTAAPQELAGEYLSGRLPAAAQEALARFMERYGVRGLGEIDLGRPRWQDDPTPLLQALQSYLQIDDPALAPDAVFERGQVAAKAEIEHLVQALRKSRGGWLKSRLARWAALRMRVLVGLRETPKFTIIRFFAMLRQALLSYGERWTAQGSLERPDDVFFLRLSELDALAAGESRDWKGLVQAHRQSSERESQRVQIPRLLLSDGRAYYGGIPSPAESGEGQLSGSPVSPGVVEGRVRVVLDPRQAELQPGEILVCPGTDPSWTPLFLAAGGLLMEVGGMMTHGAVVAREYGIPAVVGIHQVTSQLQTGQLVRVDGSTGLVTVLDD